MRLRSLVALVALLAACGGAGAEDGEGVASLDVNGTSTTAPEESADPEAAAITFTECMRENGVEMEDPTVDSEGNVIPGRPTDLPELDEDEDGNGEVVVGQAGEDLRAAFEECGDLLEGSAFGFTPEDQTELQDQLLALADCLRDQGLEVADPDFSGGPDVVSGADGEGVRVSGPFGLDFEDPEVEAAMEVCEEFAPNFEGGPVIVDGSGSSEVGD